MEKLVIYPGRFQPFHKGHFKIYLWIKKQIGKCVIATTDKTDDGKSPFNFEDKKLMMKTMGVAESDIAEVKSPYIASEITNLYDSSKTVLIFVVSIKDQERFTFSPKKNGEPSYFQLWSKDTIEQPFEKHGYILFVPTFTFSILGKTINSATEIRKLYAEADEAAQRQIIHDLYGICTEELYQTWKKINHLTE